MGLEETWTPADIVPRSQLEPDALAGMRPHGESSAHRRFVPKRSDPMAVKDIALDHPAITGARTRYLKMVVDPTTENRLLKGGENNRKIGGRVLKGRLKGMPIRTLTLEERATCPRSCEHWRRCYGNSMHWSRRLRHGPELEVLLAAEVDRLMVENPGGVLVRLHVLGGFYSIDYVDLWAGLLAKHPTLHVFGFTAWPPTSEIGRLLLMMREHIWSRFAMRFSNVCGPRNAFTLSSTPRRPRVGDAIVCPEQWQTHRGVPAPSCGSCGLCWQTDRPIAFMEH